MFVGGGGGGGSPLSSSPGSGAKVGVELGISVGVGDGIVVGDAGYRCLKVIQFLYEDFGILLQTPKAFTTYLKKPFVKWYNSMISLAVARILYRHRKPSIEPLFSLIKQLFDLQGEKQLPYKGIDKVSAFLMIGPLTVQLMMRDNFIHNRDWASTHHFLSALK